MSYLFPKLLSLFAEIYRQRAWINCGKLTSCIQRIGIFLLPSNLFIEVDKVSHRLLVQI